MHFDGIQHAKKIVSDNLGLVDFAIGLVNSVLKLPDRQVKIFGYSNYKRMGKQSCSSKIVFGLVRASYSLPVEQAAKLAFFAFWTGLFEAGLRYPRVSARFEFKYESLKSKFSLISLPTIWWLDTLKTIKKIIRESAFDSKKKKPELKFNLRLALTGVRMTGPRASHIKRAYLMYFAVLLVLHCGSKRWQIVSSRSRTGLAISDGKSVAVHSEVVWFIRCRQE